MINRVAIKLHGIVYSLPKPNRHHDVIGLIVDKTGQPVPGYAQQGFLDQNGSFMTRKEAAMYALKTGQVIKLHSPPRLFSEDLW